MPSESSPAPHDLNVRPAEPADADALADLFLRAREAAHPAIPLPVHPAEDVRRWVHGRVQAGSEAVVGPSRGAGSGAGSGVGGRVEVWLAEDPSGPVALLLLEEDWLHSLYVDPRLTGHGIGTTMLQLALHRRPQGLGLYVFETNTAARRFYARHGFGEVRRTDGSENEEGAPDVELAWPDPTSLSGLRRRIDAVDERLAELLEERARLTAAVQRLKEVPGHAGRDPDREREIVERMARSAPTLGPQRVHRIMHQVITESLDAAEPPA